MATQDHDSPGACAAYALGALEVGERAAFERHLESGCSACRDALDGYREALARVLPEAAPAGHVRAQLLDLALAPDVPPLDAADAAWRELAPGVRVQGLREDRPRGVTALLLWARPGARLGRHEHAGREVLLVLRGGLVDEGRHFEPGQVLSHAAGSAHDPHAAADDECVCYVLVYDRTSAPEG